MARPPVKRAAPSAPRPIAARACCAGPVSGLPRRARLRKTSRERPPPHSPAGPTQVARNDIQVVGDEEREHGQFLTCQAQGALEHFETPARVGDLEVLIGDRVDLGVAEEARLRIEKEPPGVIVGVDPGKARPEVRRSDRSNRTGSDTRCLARPRTRRRGASGIEATRFRGEQDARPRLGGERRGLGRRPAAGEQRRGQEQGFRTGRHRSGQAMLRGCPWSTAMIRFRAGPASLLDCA